MKILVSPLPKTCPNSKELGQVLGRGDTNINDNVWKELIDEADLNKDGEVDYDEFTKLMDKC